MTQTAPQPASLPVVIVSDVVCPWCWMGRVRLERALTMLAGEVEASIQWHPFALNPGVPREGLPRQSFMESKFGSAERLAEMHRHLVTLGQQEGIDFHFDRITVQPDTTNAHRLIAFAGDRGDAVAQALFAAFFRDGQDIGDRSVLTAVARSVGVEAEGFLSGDSGREATQAAMRQASESGVQGVPFYILNNRMAVSGAQPPEVLVEAIRASLAA